MHCAPGVLSDDMLQRLTYGFRRSSGNPYRYDGEWRYRDDGDFGLLHVGARYYEPGAGRFLSQDPATGDQWATQTLNVFTYCDNDPLNWSDTEGMQRKRKGAAKGKAVQGLGVWILILVEVIGSFLGGTVALGTGAIIGTALWGHEELGDYFATINEYRGQQMRETGALHWYGP